MGQGRNYLSISQAVFIRESRNVTEIVLQEENSLFYVGQKV